MHTHTHAHTHTCASKHTRAPRPMRLFHRATPRGTRTEPITTKVPSERALRFSFRGVHRYPLSPAAFKMTEIAADRSASMLLPLMPSCCTAVRVACHAPCRAHAVVGCSTASILPPRYRRASDPRDSAGTRRRRRRRPPRDRGTLAAPAASRSVLSHPSLRWPVAHSARLFA